MGMTIDESIDWIKNTILDMRRAQICISDRLALETAIDTMRKYQKIRRIAFPLQFCTTDKLNYEAIMKICEVLEDGKNV